MAEGRGDHGRVERVAATPAEHRAYKCCDARHGILCEPPAKREATAEAIVAWLERYQYC